MNKKLRENIYREMDSFLVETDKQRSLAQLNQDRHLFVENMERNIREYIDSLLPKQPDTLDESYNKGAGFILDQIKSKL